MSNVVVLLGTRRATIKTTPGKPLSEIRTEACRKFDLATPSNYILKRAGAKLDLSLPLRLANLPPGAQLQLVQTTAISTPVSIVLRTVDPVSQLSSTFPPSTSIWGILRKFEQDLKDGGNSNANITERCAPSGSNGSGRLLYQMPAVRVANRELTNLDELKKTLEELGCNGRELLVLRFLPTEIPYEDALMEIAGITAAVPAAETVTPPSEVSKTANTTEEATQGAAAEDVVMSDSNTPQQPENTEITSETATEQSDAPEPESSLSSEPKIAVYQPSSSETPAAASFEVPESAYEVGIADLKRIKDTYHAASQPKRLPSDKEIAEKEAALREEMEKINNLKIKVRFPDGYISQQELDGKYTAQDLYTLIRGTLRYPEEPFVLRIPPRDTIKDDTKRLTLDLKLRSGASLHLQWNKEASEKAKNSPALKDELMQAAKELPKPTPPAFEDAADDKDDKDEATDKGKRKENTTKADIEKKLKGFLRFGKK